MIGNNSSLDPVRFGRAICGDLAAAERREWWIANGLGGYAGGTVAGSLSRRYHGLLIAPIVPLLGRHLLLAKVDATLTDGARSYPLFTNRWRGGAVDPRGNALIESFELDYSIPVWTYECGGMRIEARVWMEQGANTVYLAWRLFPDAGPGWTLRATVLANERDHHGSTNPGAFNPRIETAGDTLHVSDRSTLTLCAPGGNFAPRREWYRDFDLPIEAERGLDATDCHLCVGDLSLPLAAGAWRGVVASLEPNAAADIAAALERRLVHDRAVLEHSLSPLPLAGEAAERGNPTSPASGRGDCQPAPATVPPRLVLAADAFLFARPLPDAPDGLSVIAGYPWFGDWGRDTMIALPGLALATGRAKDALAILRTFTRFVSEGMLPNVFPGAGETAEYNTADAALWFFEAWRALVAATDDVDALRAVYPTLADMIAWHVKGTRFGIGVDPADGLLRAGVPGVQVTWMDAKVGDWVVTPRIGKPVEINALWYNALRIVSGFASRLGLPDDYVASADRAREGFKRFVRDDGEGLYDVLDGPNGNDARIRPNQIFAVSLPHSPLERAQQEAVVRVCRAHLLTSYGLRSLAPNDPDYHRRYEGDVAARDGGYHQGPVWGWLAGHFALASFRAGGDAEAARSLLVSMLDALTDQGIGTIGEIFDGDPPHHPRGAPAQAWSVGCTLQAWHALTGGA